MSRLYLRKDEVRSGHPVGSWQSVLFSEFEAQMSSEARPFPCVFGVTGYRHDQLRYLFLDPIDIETLGRQLALFVSESRSHGPNTSLVLFTRPRPVQTLDAYYKKFWRILDQLARIDKQPWPAEIPETVDDPMWEFSFAGEPIFVVCSTPAHVMRQSRRSSAFMLTFQPRWVFERMLGTEQAADKAFGEVRKRLVPFDTTAASPLLGRYGNPEGREFKQYFLYDDNQPPPACPFHKLAQAKPSASGDKEQAA
ncbi:YqcI/YcgG family protein [Bradyrhizobium oligotrophicum]|uniref:YqcI/YcgG family protein n=1 Tax=Bradyrhizobium oligotrophicum TaxID=44255 RepID=UPI003EBBBC10